MTPPTTPPSSSNGNNGIGKVREWLDSGKLLLGAFIAIAGWVMHVEIQLDRAAVTETRAVTNESRLNGVDKTLQNLQDFTVISTTDRTGLHKENDDTRTTLQQLNIAVSALTEKVDLVLANQNSRK